MSFRLAQHQETFLPRARATSQWFDDLKEIVTDGSSLSILPVYDTYSNLRAASTLYNRAVQVSNNNYQIVALWHPDTPIIIFGKRLPINNNRRFNGVQHLVIKQSQDYGFNVLDVI